MLPLLLAVEVLPVAAPLELELVVDPEVLLVLEVLDVALDAAVEVLDVEEEVVPMLAPEEAEVPLLDETAPDVAEPFEPEQARSSSGSPAIQRVWSMVPSWICGLLMAAWAAYSR